MVCSKVLKRDLITLKCSLMANFVWVVPIVQLFILHHVHFNGLIMCCCVLHSCCCYWGNFSRRTFQLHRISAAYVEGSEAISNCSAWPSFSYCVGGSHHPPKLLVHCVAASIFAHSHKTTWTKAPVGWVTLRCTWGMYACFAWTGEGNCWVH